MTHVFLAPKFDDSPELYIVQSMLGDATNAHENTLFTNALPRDYHYTDFDFVPSLAEADIVLVPQPVRRVTPEIRAYLDVQVALARAQGKRVVVFTRGDLSHDVFIPDVVLCKGSQYGYLRQPNEIIAIPFVEDLAEQFGVHSREKQEIPVVSFCGWAGFASRTALWKYHLKNFAITMRTVLTGNAHLEVHRKGIYFRRAAMRILAASSRVRTNFIIRETFSASKKTISLDPAKARKEYVDSMINSDFVLAPKGDGNFSVRFFEALALGRVPILIDTDCVLPREDAIDYASVILRVPYTELHTLPDRVADFYASHTPEAWLERQRRARALFVTQLRYDRFMSALFASLGAHSEAPSK